MNCAKIYDQFIQLWKIALPLMLTSLSGMCMIFVDRLILANYALEAHNAAVEATNIGWAFIIGLTTLTSISHVFVSQYTGAGRYKEVGPVVWQMIWFSLACSVIFMSLSSYCVQEIFGKEPSCEMQRTYLAYMLYFTPMHGVFAALYGFYIGRSRPFYPTCLAILGNIINAICSYLLVFGFAHFQALGAKGAAIATNISVTLQVLMLFIGFLTHTHRQNFGTNRWKLDFFLLKKALTIGLPNAFFTLLEATGWAFFYKMMADLGHKHLTVAGMVQSILLLSFFFSEGMSKAVTVRVGYLVGAKKLSEIKDVLTAGFFFTTLFVLLLAGFLAVFYKLLIHLFLQGLTSEEGAYFYTALVFGYINAVIYKYLEGIRMVIAGALIAATDTYFLLTAGTACVWIGLILPIYFFVYRTKGSIEKALVLCSVYTLLAAIVYLWRFYSYTWQKRAAALS